VRRLLLAGLLLTLCQAFAQDSAALKASADQRLKAGDNEAAFHQYEEAVAALPAGPDSPEAAALDFEISLAFYNKQDGPRSRIFAERAVDLRERLSGPRSLDAARALRQLALALHISGDYAGATPKLETALQIQEKELGPEDAQSIQTLNYLSLNVLRAGDTARARILQERSLALCEKKFGPDHRLTIEAHQFLGQILDALGDFKISQQHQALVLAGLERQKGPETMEVADALVSIGNTCRNSGAPADALRYLRRAAAIYEKLLGPHNPRLGGTLDNTGEVLAELKQYDESRQTLERALAIQSQELGPRHPWTANVIQGLARTEAAAGNYERARALFDQNLDIWREKLGPEHPFTVVSMTLQADVLAHLGRRREALDTSLAAAAIRRENILLTVRTVDERQALQYAGLHTASMDTALSIAVRPDAGPEDAGRTWDALIRSRALVLDEMSARYRTIQGSEDPAVTALARKVADARSQITKLVLQGPGSASLAEHRKRLEQVRANLQSAEDRLAVASAGFRRERDQYRVGFSEVRDALPPGSALVAFRQYRRKAYQAAEDVGTPSYIAFVLAGRSARPVAVPLGPAARIDGLVKKWREEVDRERASLGRSAKTNELAYRTAAAALRLAIWDPIERGTGKAVRVFIVPDGALQMVNFAALPAADGKYLVESGPLLHILTAERDLVDKRPAMSGGQLLAVANPAFEQAAETRPAQHRGSESSCADFASTRFGDLPGSLQEVRAILQIWNARGWQASKLTGGEANEASVKRSVAGKRVVHFATHGFFFSGDCPQDAGATRDNPLLRAGLALAGANQRGQAPAGQEDGILTAEEVASLDLGKAEWVVLSGCDTGVGDPQAGEGLLGLRRAFQEAGARTLISSLWPVDDQESRHWMAALYRARFVAGAGTAEAIRTADLERLRALRGAGKSAHPFYWAGFLAVGDWR
jgi:CHAT domain-containing protein/tetratricopeptide (TPR) repeat protein